MNFKPGMCILVAATALVAACGGGGGSAPAASPAPAPAPAPPPAPLLIVPLGGTIQTSIPTPTYAADAYELAMLTQLNELRRKAGAGLLQQVPAIDVASLGHAKWSAINGAAHVQTIGTVGFTGVNINDRYKAAGYTAATDWSESIGGRSAFHRPADCAPWVGPYHAADLFGSWTHAGMAQVDQSTVPGAPAQPSNFICVFNFAITDSTRSGQVPASGAMVTFPHDGGAALYRSNIGQEVPRAPVSVLPNDMAGPTIVAIVRNADWINWKADGTLDPTVTQFEIKDDLGNVIPVGILANSRLKAGPGVVLNSDSMLRDGALTAVPLNPLTLGKVYRVNFSATLKPGAPAITKSWTFTANETGLN